MAHLSEMTQREIALWAEEKIGIERNKNDARDLDATETAFIRGRISLLKDLLALPKKEAQAHVSDLEY